MGITYEEIAVRWLEEGNVSHAVQIYLKQSEEVKALRAQLIREGKNPDRNHEYHRTVSRESGMDEAIYAVLTEWLISTYPDLASFHSRQAIWQAAKDLRRNKGITSTGRTYG
jgi:hypothetical protein